MIEAMSFWGNAPGPTVQADALINWVCFPGQYMLQAGPFTGDFAGCYPCSAGYFGTAPNHTSPLCGGACRPGHFCSEGSTCYRRDHPLGPRATLPAATHALLATLARHPTIPPLSAKRPAGLATFARRAVRSLDLVLLALTCRRLGRQQTPAAFLALLDPSRPYLATAIKVVRHAPLARSAAYRARQIVPCASPVGSAPALEPQVRA